MPVEVQVYKEAPVVQGLQERQAQQVPRAQQEIQERADLPVAQEPLDPLVLRELQVQRVRQVRLELQVVSVRPV